MKHRDETPPEALLQTVPLEDDSEPPAINEAHAHKAQGVHSTSVDQEPDTLATTLRLGAWQLVQELGSGGMGTVWLAERADGAFRMKAAPRLYASRFK